MLYHEHEILILLDQPQTLSITLASPTSMLVKIHLKFHPPRICVKRFFSKRLTTFRVVPLLTTSLMFPQHKLGSIQWGTNQWHKFLTICSIQQGTKQCHRFHKLATTRLLCKVLTSRVGALTTDRCMLGYPQCQIRKVWSWRKGSTQWEKLCLERHRWLRTLMI